MTIKSQPLDFAVSIIAVAGCAFGTCKSSADIPICSAIARASSSTLPAFSLAAASKRSTSVGEGIHPEASPPTGSGSVTVMTVTLAFKAFAKAIPCLTPFLARSDPSVLKRILAYIRGLLDRRTFSLVPQRLKASRHHNVELGRAQVQRCRQKRPHRCPRPRLGLSSLQHQITPI